MCSINEGGDINEAEGKKEIKEGTLRLTGKGFFFFKRWCDCFFRICRIFFFFFLYIQFEAQKLKDTFDRRPCCWWIRRVRFTDCCGDRTCQHKLNGRNCLTAHQSLGKIPKMLHIKCFPTLLLIRSRGEMSIVNSFGLCGSSSAVTKDVSWRRAASMID